MNLKLLNVNKNWCSSFY